MRFCGNRGTESDSAARHFSQPFPTADRLKAELQTEAANQLGDLNNVDEADFVLLRPGGAGDR